MVFQNPDAQLVGDTAWEDVCFGLENLGLVPDEVQRRAEEALRWAGLYEVRDRPVATLSGGQKQLLCIAGCLALRPDVYVMDEVTAMLDPDHRSQVLAAVRQLHREGYTILWVTQWMEELAFTDRVLALHLGRLVYDGDARTFFYGPPKPPIRPDHGTPHPHPADPDCPPCELLGLQPPFAVQVARRLSGQDPGFTGRPLTAQELAEAVRGR